MKIVLKDGYLLWSDTKIWKFIKYHKKQSSILVVSYWVQVNLKSAIQIWKNKQLYHCTECQDLRFKVLFKYQYQLIVEIRRVHTFSKKWKNKIKSRNFEHRIIFNDSTNSNLNSSSYSFHFISFQWRTLTIEFDRNWHRQTFWNWRTLTLRPGSS